jgi:outer membrane protein OmpA-like peptidoglycan-associated protein
MRKLTLIATSLLTLSLASLNASAGFRQYAASIDSSNWQLAENSRLSCTLSHDIPRYGRARFSSKASRDLNLDFELDMRRLPDTYALAEVRSVSPAWRPGQADRTIAQMALQKQFNPGLPKKAAWTILSELEQGMNPTFYYQDWYSENDKVSVGLSTAKFHQAYDQFIECVGNLLNFSFDDISYTVLNYQSNSDELTKASQKRLGMIREYLAHDTNLELILIDAFTDSYGGRWPNQKLSERRADKIREYFVANGIEASRIEANGYGEKRHIASNQTVLGRATNRRVVIRMQQP